MDRARDFFVSYTSADEQWAVWIAHVLEEAGYTVVIQSWDFRPGSNFVVEMQKALQSSDRLIAVLSPDYLAARFPQPEWAAVFAADPEGTKRKLVPVMVKNCEPDGLIGQVVQIRIHGLSDAAAKETLLRGVQTGRAKPTESPAFPGAPGMSRGTSDGANTRSGTQLVWQPLPNPVEVIWRNALDNRLPNQSGFEAAELHLVPVGDEARLQMREFANLSGALAEHGRQRGIFPAVDALDVRSDASRTSVINAARGAVAGLALTRFGQRSTWTALPRDMLGAILDESHLSEQLASMLAMLTALPLPAPDLVVPVVGIEPAAMVSVGKVTDLPRSSAQLGHGMPMQVRPPADEAIAFVALHDHRNDIAAELAARLVAEHKAAARLS